MPSTITLYTAHHCPWAQRAQITLRELDLEFETVLVNINIPRTPEYLAINPRGLVPTLVHDGHMLTESGLITQFLVDLYPSHLLKSSSEPGGALQRFNVAFFDESYFTKAHCHFDTAIISCDEEETTAAQKYIDGIVNHIEPLLEDAAPFFGNSSRLTFAEASRNSTWFFFIGALEDKAPNFWRWSHAVIGEATVTAVWDEEDVVKRTFDKIEAAKLRGKALK
ncbi:uncharacterized protein N7484_001458 [Penicillium longicatenatum]|uniref:uncharacterized protein n=1 Tax=Penicillium longicatenatum TaxID=1561947 RepID=UPI002549B709|nr:uncharacterized protein N7484_001458 [Penicillium longicatenatum]KAJ5657809.1 hypothetical protein N7484_001458 [Penicillium longicatenatum]